ncbi:hypothetical protein SLOPH_1815 [Spraguea lophii 42_110]|uniref:Uncharacterized protein n=1 Tax=Spraguea lophii (strain 42_110) TaxID=1358809 RepID=S7W9I9_SPRLO|nr:hypothetical protein SLOPH_1815 [Spraguea lophii 42_110]
MGCISCNEPANIKLKDISYCNNCFGVQFKRKIMKVLKKNNSNILLIMNNDTLKFYILKFIISQIFSNNKKITYKITENIKHETDDAVLLADECLDDIAINIFEGFSNNMDLYNIQTQSSIQKEHKILYPFFYISRKELIYFYFLNRKEIEGFKYYKMSEERKVIYNFLNTLAIKNYSTNYNIIEALKKGIEVKKENEK